MVAMLHSGQDLGGKSDSKPVHIAFDKSKWNLVWSDEFDKDGLPDPSKWGYEEGYIRNGEKQYYTKARKENARVEGGHLIIEGRNDNWEGKPVTSASLTTAGKKSFLYGRIEARLKVPTGKGTWPAFWMLGENIGEVGWPKCGETDIMEYVGFDPDKLHANIHCETFNHTKGTGKGSTLTLEKPWEGFHVYAVEWYPDRMEFFIDDTRYFVYRKPGDSKNVWPFGDPQYVILNLAIGGAWGGAQGIDDSIYPAKYEIDYVRYYMPKRGS